MGWRTRAGAWLATLTGRWRQVYKLAFSPDSKTLATGSIDNMIKLWNVATWEEMTTFPGPGGVHALAFGPDGTLAAGYSNGTVHLWRTGVDQGDRTADK